MLDSKAIERHMSRKACDIRATVSPKVFANLRPSRSEPGRRCRGRIIIRSELELTCSSSSLSSNVQGMIVVVAACSKCEGQNRPLQKRCKKDAKKIKKVVHFPWHIRMHLHGQIIPSALHVCFYLHDLHVILFWDLML